MQCLSYLSGKDGRDGASTFNYLGIFIHNIVEIFYKLQCHPAHFLKVIFLSMMKPKKRLF